MDRYNTQIVTTQQRCRWSVISYARGQDMCGCSNSSCHPSTPACRVVSSFSPLEADDLVPQAFAADGRTSELTQLASTSGERSARHVVGRRTMSMDLALLDDPSTTHPRSDQSSAWRARREPALHPPPKASRQASGRSRAPRTKPSRREGFAADQTELAHTSGTHGRPNHGPGRSRNLRGCGAGYRDFTP